MPEQKTRAGVVIILVWRRQFLLILRDNKPEILSPNTWCPVTGGREEDENLVQAAHREVFEEIGLVPQDLLMLGVSLKGNGFFFGRLTDEEHDKVVLGEGQDLRYFAYERLREINLSGAMAIYLERYPEVFRQMAETERPPFGRELGLATWNGEHE